MRASPTRRWRPGRDPVRLAREAAKPPAQRSAALRELDLDSLADFMGLTEKVRHNQVRGDLEMTFRLLRITGQEIQLFRDYAPTSLQRRARRLTSPTQRLDGLVEFTESWAGTDPQRCLVRDVLRYEHTVARFRRDTSVEEDREPAVLLTDSVLTHHGTIVAVDATCHPVAVLDALRAHEPDLQRIERQPYVLVYHRSPCGRFRALEVEPGARALLDAVDGRSSVRELAQLLFGDDALADALRAAYQALADIGLVTTNGAPTSCN